MADDPKPFSWAEALTPRRSPDWRAALTALLPQTAALGQAADWFAAQLAPPATTQLPPRIQQMVADVSRRRETPATVPAPVQRAGAALRDVATSAPVRRAGRAASTYARSLFEPSPEIAATGAFLKDLGARETQADDPFAAPFLALPRLVGNLAVDTLTETTTPGGAALNVDLPIGPALKTGGALIHAAGLLPPGFFSRVDRVVDALPKKGAHPNKVRSLLKSGASQEEVGFRQLDQFLAAKGDQAVTPAELQAHLAAHPPPQLETTVLGDFPRSPEVQAELDRITDLRDRGGQISHHEWRRRRDEILARHPDRPTKYSSYTMPGGEAYRESLLRLSEPHKPAP